jgi:poly-gamma-glutamate capsule biosynthesis protein CapA/YwtB (metallophosphatase superfamily)
MLRSASALCLCAALACSPGGVRTDGAGAPTAEGPASPFEAGAALTAAAAAGVAKGSGEPAAAAPHRAAEVVILLGGDVNLGRHVGQRLLADPGYRPFRGVQALIDRADLVIVNLESPLTDQGGQTRHPSEPNVFAGPPIGARALAEAGVGAVSVANNHAWDYGLPGFLETLAHLSRAGVASAGGSSVVDAPFEPAVVRVRGWSIALIAATDRFNLGPLGTHEARRNLAWAGSGELPAALANARKEHDLVLASVHAGREYQAFPDRTDVVRFRDFADAGADAVLGHHPHVLQGISWHRGAPLFHSLGNLAFGIHRRHPWSARSVLVRLTVAEGRPPEVAVCPIVIVHDEPHALGAAGLGGRVGEYRERIRALSEPLGGIEIGEDDADGCFPVGPSERAAPALTARDRSAAPLVRLQ